MQSLCSEEAVHGLCTLEAEIALGDALAQQAGVRHLSVLFCTYE